MINRNSRRYSSTYLQGRWYRRVVPALFRGKRRVLDLGCGDGRGIDWALAGGAKLVVGVDVVEGPLRWSMARTPRGRVHYVLSDLHSLRFREGAFDLITAFEVLQYLEGSYERTVRQYVRYLAPGGLFVTSDPSWEGSLIYAVCSRDLESVRSIVRNRRKVDVNGGLRHRARCFADGEVERIFSGAGMALERRESLPILPALVTQAFPRDTLAPPDQEALVRMLEGLVDGSLSIPKNHLYVFRKV